MQHLRTHFPSLSLALLFCTACVDELPTTALGLPIDATVRTDGTSGSVDGSKPTDGTTDGLRDSRDQEVQPDGPPPPPERCDGIDNDNDGDTDEGFGVGSPCGAGLGACTAVGEVTCLENGSNGCSATPGIGSAERCNEIDDDCDGRTDEGLGLNVECSEGQGACLRGGVTICDGAGGTVCGAAPGEPVREACNGADDDCDGTIDEDLGLGEPCTSGLGACREGGVVVCVDDTIGCSAVPGMPVDEACNVIDDDCDSHVDEEVNCGAYVESHCQFSLGWADNDEGPEGPSETWGDCSPQQDTDMDGDVRCIGTRRNGRFRRLQFPDGYYYVDWNDQFGVALTCEDPNTDLAEWVQTHCAIYLGHADYDGGAADPSANWGPCPGEIQGVASADRDAQRCTSTGFDGRFRAMGTVGHVNPDDDFGLAFRCEDASSDDRAAFAATLTTQAEAVLAWVSDPAYAPDDHALTWPYCDGDSDIDSRDAGCVRTGGDGLFHRLDIGRFMHGNSHQDDEDYMGISLRAFVP